MYAVISPCFHRLVMQALRISLSNPYIREIHSEWHHLAEQFTVPKIRVAKRTWQRHW